MYASTYGWIKMNNYVLWVMDVICQFFPLFFPLFDIYNHTVIEQDTASWCTTSDHIAKVDSCYNNVMTGVRAYCLDGVLIWGCFYWGRFAPWPSLARTACTSLTARLKLCDQSPIVAFRDHAYTATAYIHLSHRNLSVLCVCWERIPIDF